MSKIIHVIAVAFERNEELKVFVQSWLNQTAENWLLTVIHDGPSKEFEKIMRNFQREKEKKIRYICTDKRHNDYGHTLRNIGLGICQGEYVLLSNADNYFIPKAIEYLNIAIEHGNGEPDVVMYNMIHSHNRPGGRPLPPYSYFEVEYKRGSIDVSAAIVKSNIAKNVGFNDKSHDGDATYFEEIERSVNKLIVYKLPNVLFVHN